MDAILAQGVTQLVDALTAEKVDLSALSVDQRRDLLLLAALYDQSTGEPIERRWSRLRRRSGFRPLWSRRDLQIGFGTTLLVVALLAALPGAADAGGPALAARCRSSLGWLYWGWRLARAEWFARDIRKGLRVLSRDPAGPALGAALVQARASWAASPCRRPRGPAARSVTSCSASSRRCCSTLGYAGIIVLIDRVDEPQLIEGDPRKMRALIWPLLDHKFLRHPGIGVKLLLPIELAYYLEKEDKEFYDRARPDKLNMIKPLALDRPVALRPGRRPPPRLRGRARRPTATAPGSASSSTSRSATTRSRTRWATCGPPGSSSSSSTACSRSTATATPRTPRGGRSTPTPSARPTRPTCATSRRSTGATGTVKE